MKIFLSILAFFSISVFIYGSVKDTTSGIEFSYDNPNAQSVSIAGDFNNWNTTGNPLKKDENGLWKTVIKLSKGEYQYKFVVDGNWFFDQDNPNTADDGYGGSNSLIEIDSNGKMIRKSALSISGVKTTLNPKVYLSGRYYTRNEFNRKEKDRYMLDKPVHSLNFGIKTRMSSYFEGCTFFKVDNEQSNFFTYKKAYLKLKTDYFHLNAFDNLGIHTSDDPLHIIGDEGKYKYDFGYGFRGIFVKSSESYFDKILAHTPLHLDFDFLVSENIKDEEGDILSGRSKLKFNMSKKENRELDVILGSSIFNFKTTESGLIQKHNSKEIDLTISKNIFQNGWMDPMNFEVQSEYLDFKNSYEAPFLLNDINIEKDYKWMDGSILYLGSSLKFPLALSVYSNFIQNNLNWNIVTEIDTLDAGLNTITENFKRNKFSIGSDFETQNISALLELQYWTINFPDSLVGWADYYEYLERTDGNGRWFQEYSEVPFEKYTLIGYEKGLLWKSNLAFRNKIIKFPFEFRLKNTFAHFDFMKVPKYVENIVIFKLDISPKWTLYSNTRIPYYNDDVLCLKTDFKENIDVFYANYSEIMYHLADNIRLSLGWGVNPRTLNSVTDEFYEGGREEFLEQADDFADYIETSYRGLGDLIRNAETQLKQEQRITLEAVITF